MRTLRTKRSRPIRLMGRIIPILAIEGIRIPFLLATFTPANMQDVTGRDVLLLVGAANVCPWIVVFLGMGARRENGFATVWDRLSGTRVIVKPTGTVRPTG